MHDKGITEEVHGHFYADFFRPAFSTLKEFDSKVPLSWAPIRHLLATSHRTRVGAGLIGSELPFLVFMAGADSTMNYATPFPNEAEEYGRKMRDY